MLARRGGNTFVHIRKTSIRAAGYGKDPVKHGANGWHSLLALRRADVGVTVEDLEIALRGHVRIVL